MNDLSRNLLNAAREGMSPDAAAMARVRAKVAAATAGTTGGAVAIPTAKTGLSLGTKLAILAVALGIGVTATTLLVTRSPAPNSAPHIAIATTESDVAGAPAPAARVTSPAHIAAASDEPVATPTTPHAATAAAARGLAASAAPSPTVPSAAAPSAANAAPSAAKAAAPSPAAPSSAASTPAPSRVSPSARGASAPTTDTPAGSISLAREVELIDQAMRLVRRGAATDALAAIATYEREARGQGQMAEDAAAIAIEAHCSLGHDVTARVAAFDRRWPSSAQRSRIHDACFTK